MTAQCKSVFASNQQVFLYKDDKRPTPTDRLLDRRKGTPSSVPQCSRRNFALAFPIMATMAVPVTATSAAPDVVMPSETLRVLSGLATAVLKPVYQIEAPLQAGSYDQAAVRERIQQEVTGSPVVIYSYSLSPFCSQAKEFLDSLGAKYTEIVLGPEWLPGLLDDEGAAVRAELGKMTGQTSMPHIFIGGQSVGGLFSGTPGLVPLQEAGELSEKLKAAGAL
eukprot:s2054_g14.t1